MLTVVCFHWFDPVNRWNSRFIYTHEHVNRLRRAVARNLKIPHWFVVATDDPTQDYDPGIVRVALDPELRQHGARYAKLQLFAPDAELVFGGDRLLMLDLDTVIVGDITPLVCRSEDFVIARDFLADKHPTKAIYNSSLVLLNAGARCDVREWFGQDAVAFVEFNEMLGTDQAWIALSLGPDEATFTRADGIYSFRFDLEAADGLPVGARIVNFHGAVDPSLPELQARHPWIVEHWH